MDTSYLRLVRYKPTCDIIARYRGDREVVFLGDSAPLRKILKDEYGIENDMIATRVKEHLGKKNFYPFDYFDQNSDNYYFVVPFLMHDDKLVEIFNQYGYKEFRDFVFVMHKPIRLTSPVTGYKDEYGNRIDCPAKGLNIILEAFAGNNTIKVDPSVNFGVNSKYQVFESGNVLEIAENCKFGENTIFEGRIDAKIFIKSGVRTGRNFEINSGYCFNVNIGKDCLISHWVLFLTGDGHAIFDTDSMTRTNPLYPESGRHDIMIGDYVWLGCRAAVLYNTKIGNSSIVGSQSLVKGTFPNNCVIAGNPGKVVKKNVTWHRDPFVTDICNVEEQYIKLTDEI